MLGHALGCEIRHRLPTSRETSGLDKLDADTAAKQSHHYPLGDKFTFEIHNAKLCKNSVGDGR